jgi:hypothetical protein
MLLNVGQELRQRKHATWDSGLERRISGEDYNRLNDIWRQKVEKLSNGTYMPVVLTYRVLKSELGPIQHLRPITVAGAAEDPALIVFSLDHEYPEARNQNVINLRGSIPQAESYVI